MSHQGIPYLGSKMSLISKSEIRYEGILFTVDTKESTIALAKVQSFGTEDRPTKYPVAPRDEIYDYIIFKANDIKDLTVADASNRSAPRLFHELNDPAIVSMSKAFSQPSGNDAGPTGILSGHSSHSATPQQRGAQRGVSPAREEIRLNMSSFGNNLNRRQNRRPPVGAPVEGGYRGGFGNMGFRFPSFMQHGGFPWRENEMPPPYFRHPFGPFGPTRMGFRFGMGNFSPMNLMGGGGGGRSRRPDGWNGGSLPGFRGNGANFRSNPGFRRGDSEGFDNDYDFEKAHEKFQKMLNGLKDKAKSGVEEKSKGDLAKTLYGLVLEDNKESKDRDAETGYYDKAKSFFDNISCDSRERQQRNSGLQTWRGERDQNVETFGVAAVRNYQQYRFGMMRGNFGVGGFIGGRGFNYRGRGGFRGVPMGY